MSERLNVAIKTTEEKPQPTAANQTETEQEADGKNNIVTTEDELEGFYIVKSMLRNVVQAERVTYRDAVSYFAIFCDDNNRKPICRLYFNNPNNKKIRIWNGADFIKHGIQVLDEIYNYQEELEQAIKLYIDDGK